MSDRSAIEWTDASWNPVTGCTKVSPGCDNCYAERFSERWRGIPGHHFEQGFDLRAFPERLDQPFKWKKPRRIFVNSMSDLFHGSIDEDVVYKVLNVTRKCPRHTFQVLTKREKRMRKMMVSWTKSEPAPPNLWMGVSAENQEFADRRIPWLIQTPAAVRFLSIEPMLSPMNIDKYLKTGMIHWVIVGGESGPGARGMDDKWVKSILAASNEYDVPFFFKQWGGPTPKARGRELYGRTWNGMPKGAA